MCIQSVAKRSLGGSENQNIHQLLHGLTLEQTITNLRYQQGARNTIRTTEIIYDTVSQCICALQQCVDEIDPRGKEVLHWFTYQWPFVSRSIDVQSSKAENAIHKKAAFAHLEKKG